MNKLIIIDESNCKKELNAFLETNSQYIKLLLSEEDYNIDLDILTDKLQSVFNDQHVIFFSTSKNVIKVTLKEIKYLKSKENYVELFLIDGSSYILLKSFDFYINKLENYNIIQVNQSTLINCTLTDKFLINENKLTLKTNDSFYIEKQYIQEFLSIINNLDN